MYAPILSSSRNPPVRRDRHVRLVHRRFLHLLRHPGADCRLLGQHLGIEPVLRKRAGNQRNAADHFRMLGGELERDAGAHRVAEYVDLVVAKLLQHIGHVVSHVYQADLAIAQLSPTMALKIDADHLPALCEPGQVGTEHLDLAEAPVKQQQRLAGAVDSIVVFDSVYRGMAAPGGLGRCSLHGQILLHSFTMVRPRCNNIRKYCDQRLHGHCGLLLK
jgi:hypothetical protein